MPEIIKCSNKQYILLSSTTTDYFGGFLGFKKQMPQPVLSNLLALPWQITGAIFRVLHAKKSRDNLEGTGVLASVAAWRSKHLICCSHKGGKHLAHKKFPSLLETPTGVDLNKFQKSIFFYMRFPSLYGTLFCITTSCKEKCFLQAGWTCYSLGWFGWKELCWGTAVWADLFAAAVLRACCSHQVLFRRHTSVQTLPRMREDKKE